MRSTVCSLGLVLAHLAGVALVGCGGDDDLRRLTSADVTPVPPGDAVGTEYSGRYLVTSFEVDACRCRRDSVRFCASLAPTKPQFDIAHMDGSLSGMDDAIAMSVRKDGTFAGAGVAPVIDNETEAVAGEALTRITGHLRRDGAQRMLLSMTVETTMSGVLTVGFFDCDARFTMGARRIDAAPAP